MLSRQPGCQCRWQLSHCTYHISHLISHIVGLRTFQPEIQSTMYLKVGKGSIFPYKLVIKTGSGKSPIPWAISKTDNIVIKSNSIVIPFLPRQFSPAVIVNVIALWPPLPWTTADHPGAWRGPCPRARMHVLLGGPRHLCGHGRHHLSRLTSAAWRTGHWSRTDGLTIACISQSHVAAAVI